VHRARHIHPQYADRALAVKVLHEELSKDPKVVALFRREAYVLALLKHPNVVQTFEAGAQDDRLFIAMEYIDGRDLDNMVARCQRAKMPIPLPLQMHIVGEVLRALIYAHELCDNDNNVLNLIHRDVNPANVFVSFDGRIKLGDFGVASITAGRVERSRELAGKVGYFAPEQLAGDPVDHRADLFALGVMMFEMLCGVRLFDAEDADQAMRLNKRAKVPKPTKLNPAIPPGLERAMLTALERKPQDRFASGRDMLKALEPFLPDPTGMHLAVAAIMRMVFLGEHMQELQLQEGLAGKSAARGTGQSVEVYTRDERGQVAFRELLVSRGYRVQVHGDLESLCDAVLRQTPQAILADVSQEEFSPHDFNAVVHSVADPIPVIAVSNGLDSEAIHHASAVGAVDLLFKPFNIERVLTSVRSTMAGHHYKHFDEQRAPSEHCRVMVVSADPNLSTRLNIDLTAKGFTVEVLGDPHAALARADEASFHLIVYDAHPATAADRLFAAQYRNSPGMGLVPILYLVDDAARSMFRGMLIDRTAVLSRAEVSAQIAQTLLALRNDSTTGRTFVRYHTQFPAELRYGGRVFPAAGIDVSRGGVMLQCDQIPPVGTPISVIMHLPAGLAAQASGRVIRVDLVRAGDRDLAQVGIEFDTFADRSEADLIGFIRHLDSGQGLTPTLRLDADTLARSS
jgi:DNA-binding response OmpR family regulator